MTDQEQIRLVVSQVARERGIRIREDAAQAAWIGLMGARRRFDPSRSRWQTYAEHRIRGAVFDWLREEDALSRKEREKWNRDHPEGGSPFLQMIDEALQAPGKSIDPIDILWRAEVRGRLLRALASVRSERNRKIISAVLGGELQCDVARHHGISEGYVTQIMWRARRRLRRLLLPFMKDLRGRAAA